MSKKLLAAGTVGAIAVGAVVALNSGGEKNEVENVPEPIQVTGATEKSVCTSAVRTPGGRLVRIVGIDVDDNAAAEDTELGRAVVVGEAGRGICHVLLDAPAKKSAEKDGVACSGDYADIPELYQYFGQVSCPVKIHGSDSDGSHLWSVLLQGSACALAGDLHSFKGSDMHDFLRLSDEDKRRLLRVRGGCPIDGGLRDCVVPWGDPRAVPNSPVMVPHSWAGRSDLNYVQAVGGKPELRYDPPDGGFEK